MVKFDGKNDFDGQYFVDFELCTLKKYYFSTLKCNHTPIYVIHLYRFRNLFLQLIRGQLNFLKDFNWHWILTLFEAKNVFF